MKDELRLMVVLAHPDDESLGTGGILAKYAAEGVGTYVVTATRGERGWFGDPEHNPGLTELGKTREAELRHAAEILSVTRLDILDYLDGDLDKAELNRIVSQLVGLLREIRPQVVVTFDPSGGYGHPDHIAISQFTMTAVISAADPAYTHQDFPQPHRVSKFYYLMASESMIEQYQRVFGELMMVIDGVERRMLAVKDWMLTTRIDTTAYWEQVWSAVRCHQSQVGSITALGQVSEAEHRQLWGNQSFFRVFSGVNSGRKLEEDLFEGLR